MRNPRSILSPLFPSEAMCKNPPDVLDDVGDAVLVVMLAMMSVGVGVALDTGVGRGGEFLG